MKLEADYRRDKSEHSGRDVAYTVEARYAFQSPVQIGGQMFDNRWRKVEFEKGTHGVPPRKSWGGVAERYDMLGYSQAQALRWWLHAEADTTMSGICLETRLIKHEISYSGSAVAVSQHCIISGKDRSNCIPDWDSGSQKAEVSDDA